MQLINEEIKHKEITGIIGERVHAGLRKLCKSKASHRAWKAITEMPDYEWYMVCSAIADEIISQKEQNNE